MALLGTARKPGEKSSRSDAFWLVAAAGLALTALVWLTPFLRFAYRSETLHVTLETTGGLITMLAGYMVLGRYWVSESRRDLYLAAALFVLGANGFLLAFPWGGIGSRGDLFIWRGVTSRVVGASLFAWAALLPRAQRQWGDKRRSLYVIGALIAGSLTLSLVVASLVDIDLGIPASLAPPESSQPDLVGHPLLLAVQLFVMVLYTIAAFALRRSARAEDDKLLGWLAMGAIVLAVARLNYFLFPSIYSEWTYSGDLFRVVGQTMFLLGSAGEVRDHWSRLAAAAVVEERRSIAHDLHDGLAQELALIAGNARRLKGKVDEGEPTRGALDIIALASERALREARSAIKSLSSTAEEDLGIVLRTAAEEAAANYRGALSVKVHPSISLSLRAQEGLRWIVAEAVANAAKHADPTEVVVRSVGRDADWAICIEDNGTGFDTERKESSGFGLTMMKERAKALGFDFKVESKRRSGTVVTLRPARGRAKNERDV